MKLVVQQYQKLSLLCALEIQTSKGFMPELRPQQWRLLHFDALGASKSPAIIDASSGSITSLESIELDEFGDSLAAAFTGRTSTLNIGNLDIFEIQSRQTPLSAWTSIYAGEVKAPGIKNSYENSTIKLVGLKQRLYETAPIKTKYGKLSSIPANQTQAFEVARQIIEDLSLDGSIGTAVIYNAANFITTSVTTQQIIVGGSSVGRLLDILASSCNAVWGVNAEREVYFTPRPFLTLTLTESQYTIVKFKDPTAEGVVNRIDFFVPVPNGKDFVSYTVKNASSISVYGERRRTSPVPTEYSIIKEIKTGIGFYVLDPAPINGSNSFSEVKAMGGSTSYALGSTIPQASLKSLSDKKFLNGITPRDYCTMLGDSDNILTYPRTFDSELWMVNNSGKKVGLVAVAASISTGSLVSSYFDLGGFDKAVNLYLETALDIPTGPSAGTFTTRTLSENQKSVASNAQNEDLAIEYGYYPTYFTDTDPNNIVRIIGRTTGGQSLGPSLGDNPNHTVFISEFRAYELDNQFLEALAETLFKDPPPDPATIKILEDVIAPKQIIEITTTNHGLLTKRAKLFRYKFTSEEDYGVTEIELEQAYNARDTAQASVTKDRDLNALSIGNQFTLATSRNQEQEEESAAIAAPEYHETLFTITTQTAITNYIVGTLTGLTPGKKYHVSVGAIRHDCSSGNTSGVTLQIVSGASSVKLCHLAPIASNFVQDISGNRSIICDATGQIAVELRAQDIAGTSYTNGLSVNAGLVLVSAKEIEV
jgi:hypothetical protein